MYFISHAWYGWGKRKQVSVSLLYFLNFGQFHSVPLSVEGIFQKWTETVNGSSQLGKGNTNSEEIVNSN